MIQANLQLIDVETFLTRDDDGEQYELIDGEVIDLEATGLHEQVYASLLKIVTKNIY